LHVTTNSLDPGHESPPSHVLLNVKFPPPQLREQEPLCIHSDQAVTVKAAYSYQISIIGLFFM